MYKWQTELRMHFPTENLTLDDKLTKVENKSLNDITA